MNMVMRIWDVALEAHGMEYHRHRWQTASVLEILKESVKLQIDPSWSKKYA